MEAGSSSTAEELSKWWLRHALLETGFFLAGGATAVLLALIFDRRRLFPAFASGVFACIGFVAAGLHIRHPLTIVFGVVVGLVAFGALFACKKAKINDPALVISGFGAGGVLGTLLVDRIHIQLVGVAACFIWYGLMVGAWALLVRQLMRRERPGDGI